MTKNKNIFPQNPVNHEAFTKVLSFNTEIFSRQYVSLNTCGRNNQACV